MHLVLVAEPYNTDGSSYLAHAINVASIRNVCNIAAIRINGFWRSALRPPTRKKTKVLGDVTRRAGTPPAAPSVGRGRLAWRIDSRLFDEQLQAFKVVAHGVVALRC